MFLSQQSKIIQTGIYPQLPNEINHKKLVQKNYKIQNESPPKKKFQIKHHTTKAINFAYLLSRL